jgi:hypothetical protein
MNTITNVIMKRDPIYKRAELANDASIKITLGTKSDQRFYMASWNGSAWKVTPINQ